MGFETLQHKELRGEEELKAIFEKWKFKAPALLAVIVAAGLSIDNRQTIEKIATEVKSTAIEVTLGEKRAEVYQEIDSGEWMLIAQKPDKSPELQESKIHFKLSGFEKMDRVKAQDIARVLNNSVPKRFLDNVEEIKFDPQDQAPSSQYGLKAGFVEIAHTDPNNNTITFSGQADKLDQEFPRHIIDQDLIHEIAHFNDWRNRRLSNEDSIALLYSLIKRIKNPDRFKSNYVENIHNEDKKVELKLKCGEYFAEIVAAYLSPFERHLLPAADKKLVADYIKKVDPDFDLEKSDNNRRIDVQKTINAYDARHGIEHVSMKHNKPKHES